MIRAKMKYKNDYINKSRKELVDLVEDQLSSSRFKHVLRVEETAIDLAKAHGVDKEKVSIAALLHDYAKEQSSSFMEKIILEEKLDKTMLDYGNSICHGPVAAVLAEKEFGVKDKDILSAIYCHTFGRQNMSDVEKVIFIADYTEPKRSFKEAEKARKYAKDSLDKALAYIVQQTLLNLVEGNKAIYPQALDTYNWTINL